MIRFIYLCRSLAFDLFHFFNEVALNGLGSNQVWDVDVSDSLIYAATNGGLSIAPLGSSKFTNYVNGIPSTRVYSVSVTSDVNYDTVYAATLYGLTEVQFPATAVNRSSKK